MNVYKGKGKARTLYFTIAQSATSKLYHLYKDGIACSIGFHRARPLKAFAEAYLTHPHTPELYDYYKLCSIANEVPTYEEYLVSRCASAQDVVRGQGQELDISIAEGDCSLGFLDSEQGHYSAAELRALTRHFYRDY